MLHFLYVLLFLVGTFQVRAACDPAVELCRVHPHSGELTPVPVHQGGNGDSRDADVCGVIGGDGTSCLGCDGRSYPHGGAPKLDACGVCGGDGTTCCGLGLCSDHGVCVDGNCVCRLGWAGALCETAAVLCQGVSCNEENGHGECDSMTGQCICADGYAGSACQMRSCLPNGAYDTDKDVCACMPGWTGDKCDMCASAKKGHTYLCFAPYQLLSVRNLDADIQLKHGLAWKPNSVHDGVEYDCGCTPARRARVAGGDAEEDGMGARALDVVQLEDAFNRLSVIAINRFTSTQAELDAAVEESEKFCDEQFAGGVRGTILGAGVILLTIVVTFLLLVITVPFPSFGKTSKV